MGKCWKDTVVAVALLVCIVGLKAHPLEMAKGSNSAPQPDPPRWNPPNNPQNPSHVFSHWTPKHHHHWKYPDSLPSSEVFSHHKPRDPPPTQAPPWWVPPIKQQNPPPTQAPPRWVPPIKQQNPPPMQAPPQWVPPIKQQNPPSSQNHPHWYPPLKQQNPPPSQAPPQWVPPIKQQHPPPSQAPPQWYPPIKQPNPPPSQAPPQWYPPLKQQNPPLSQAPPQWYPPLKQQNPPPSQAPPQWYPPLKQQNPPPTQAPPQWYPPLKQQNPPPSQAPPQWYPPLKQQNPPPTQAPPQWYPPLKQHNPPPLPVHHQWYPPKKPQNPPQTPPQWYSPPQWSSEDLPDYDFPGKPAVKTPSNPPGSNDPQTPMGPPVLKCDVAANVRVPCGPPDISAAGCQAVSCCFDGQNCYFGKAVTVQCTKDGQFIVVVAKDATLPTIDVASSSLWETGKGCTYVDSNSQFAIYQFPVTKCGSYVTEDSSAIIYENRLSCSYEVGVGPLGAITRDSQFELLFQCKYKGTSVETVIVEVPSNNPIEPIAALGPINVELRLANGQCQTKGCNEVDAAYTSFYTNTDYPITKVLRDSVYVEVQLMDKTDPLLVLRLGRCWVTASPNPHSLPQWDILTDGCPYKDDRYLSSVVPIGSSSNLDYPTHYRRFFFKMFTFVDTGTLSLTTQQVYIHCSTDVCDAKPGRSCEPSCFRQRRDVTAVVKENAEPKAVGSVGPVMISIPKE